MRFLADLAARGSDRIGARRQRPRQRAQLLGRERNRELLDQVDQLAAGDPASGLAGFQQRLDVLVAGAGGIGLQRLERERRYVAVLDEVAPQTLVRRKPRGLEERVDIGRIVLGIDVERVAGLIGRRRALERQLEMHGFLVGLRGVEIDVLGDLGLDRPEIGAGGLGAEIDGDHRAAFGFRRRQNLDRVTDPLGGRLAEVEVAIDALDHALAAERSEPLVDCLADGAEFHIGGVAERQHAELDAVEPRRAIAHQRGVGRHGACRRVAFAPGRGDDDQTFRRWQCCEIEIGEVDQGRLQSVLARQLGKIAGELFRITGFGGVENGQRLGRPRFARPAAARPRKLPAQPGSPRAKPAG